MIIDVGALGSLGIVVRNGTANNNGFVGDVSSAGDVNNDGIDDFLVVAPGAFKAYVIYGKVGLSSIDLSAPLLPSDGYSIQVYGSVTYVRSAGDVNNDGFDDILIGSNGGGGAFPYGAGQTYLIFGKPAGHTHIDPQTMPDSTGVIFGVTFDYHGAPNGAVSSAGDINGDGYDDVIMGAPFGPLAGGFNSGGSAFVIFGKQTGWTDLFVDTMPLSDGFQISGINPSDRLGWSISSAGDINNDGYDEMLIGVPNGDVGGTNSTGNVYVIWGKQSGFTDINVAILTAAQGFVIYAGGIHGVGDINSISSAGDFNNDGFADLLITASNPLRAGPQGARAYVVYGKASGFGTIDLNNLSAADGFQVTSFNNGFLSASAAGDINNDGFADIILGDRQRDQGANTEEDSGAAYVIFGTASQLPTLTAAQIAANDSLGMVIYGDAAGDWFGMAVSGAGDVNGDNIDDVIIGAPRGDDGGTNAGEAYVIFGQAGLGGGTDFLSTTEDVPIVIAGSTLTANDTDAQGDSRFVQSVGNAVGGTVTLSGGNVTFTPTAHFYGQSSFQYVSADGNGETETILVFVNTSSQGDPVFTNAPATASVLWNSTWSVAGLSIFDGDGTTDPNGIYSVTLGSTNGTLTLTTKTGLTFTDGDGTTDTAMTFTGTYTAINTALASAKYTPTANYLGSATISISATDEVGGVVATGPGAVASSDSDTINVTVYQHNTNPTANNDTFNIIEDQVTIIAEASLTANDTDLEGNSLTVQSVASGTGGSVSLSGGNVTFTPWMHFNGAATFTYVVSDGFGGTMGATVTVNVASVNDAPAFTNLDLDVQTFIEDGGPVPLDFGTNSVTTDPDIPSPTQKFRWDTGSLTVEITGNGVPSEDVLTVISGGDLVTGGSPGFHFMVYKGATLGNYTGGTDGQPLVFTFHLDATMEGVSELMRRIAYDNLNSVNPDTTTRTVTITLVDEDGTAGGGQNTGIATTTVQVTPTNDAPSGDDNQVSVPANGTYIFSADDFGFSDVDGNNFAEVRITALPAEGVLYYDPNGDFSDGADLVTQDQVITAADLAAGRFYYMPDPDETGTNYAFFTFRVRDDGSDVGLNDREDTTDREFIFDVTAGIVAVDDALNATEDQTATYAATDLTANDTPAGGLTVTGVADGTGGTVSFDSGTGIITFIPTENFYGAATFTYTVSDGSGSATGTANVTVAPVNDDPPTVSNVDRFGTEEGPAITGNVVGNDPDGDSLTYATVGAVPTGLTFNSDGSYSYTPPADFTGVASVDYLANDGTANSGTAKLRFFISNVNDNPSFALSSTGPSATLDYTENDPAALIAPTATLTDIDTTYFEFAKLTVSFQANGEATDQLAITNTGTGPGEIGTYSDIFGAFVTYEGVIVGTFSGGANGTNLVIQFNDEPWAAIVEAVVRAISYSSTSEAPSTLSRTVNFLVTDGDGGSAQANAAVNITAVDDEPTLTATGLNPIYTENAATADLFGTVTASTVEAGQNVTSITLTLTNVTDGAAEILNIDGTDVALTDTNNVATLNGTAVVGLSGTTATVTFTSATLTGAQLQSLVDALGYRNSSENPTDANRVVTITQVVDSGSSVAPNENVTTLSIASTVNVNPTSDAATITGTITGSVTEAGGVNNGTAGTPTASADLGATDPDNTADAWQSVAAGGATANGYGTYALTATGVWTYTLNDNHASVQALVGAATLTDTFNALTVDGTSQTITITINAQGDAPTAQPDAVTTPETTAVSGNLFDNNGSGPDTDPDVPATLTISAVNGSGAAVNNMITLASGAQLTVNSNGTFTYNPNNAFNTTPTAGSGASNTPAPDSFTYTLTGGGTTTVSVTISGVDSNDFLFGTGGTDSLTGGNGNDFYFVDQAADIVNETAGQGFDVVWATVSYILAAGTDVEALSTRFWEGTGAINLTGNEIANNLYGNAGANALDGGGGNDVLFGFGGNDSLTGGTGTDVMHGGAGDDFYFIDNIADASIEAASEGYDVAWSTVNYVLAAGIEIEVLSARFWEDTTAIDLAGNALDNVLVGNNGINNLSGMGGNDILNGMGGNDILLGGAGNDRLLGGTGADAMFGGANDDFYFVDNSGDTANESAAQGFDVVWTSVSYALAAGSEIEALSAISWEASDALTLVGNDLGNALYGNAGANILNGRGGNDTLVGFGGTDSFLFDSALGAGNVDTIADFSSPSDTIVLDDAVFAALTPGTLGANAFVIGTAALDADDRIIYDSATGALYYDADGSGAGLAVQFAILQGAPPINSSDFQVI